MPKKFHHQEASHCIGGVQLIICIDSLEDNQGPMKRQTVGSAAALRFNEISRKKQSVHNTAIGRKPPGQHVEPSWEAFWYNIFKSEPVKRLKSDSRPRNHYHTDKGCSTYRSLNV